jgi:hypothetical protein
MATLSSLIIARRAASIAEVDEALARQVVRGGDLGTSILELGMIGEAELVPLLAEAHGFEPSGWELPVAPPAVPRLVPRAVALRYGIYPLEERGGELHVAVAEPLPQPVEDDLGFALGAHLRQYAAPLVRIRQAIARDYGLPLDRRFMRLLAKLEHRPDPSPSEMPPREQETPPFPGSGAVRLSESGTMIVEGAVPPPAAVSEGSPTSADQQQMVAPPRRNTWPGMLSSPPEDKVASESLPRPPRTPTTPPDSISGAAPRCRIQGITGGKRRCRATETSSEASGTASEGRRRRRASRGIRFRATKRGAAAWFRGRSDGGDHRPDREETAKARGAGVERGALGWGAKGLSGTPSRRTGVRARRGPLTAAVPDAAQAAATAEQAVTIFFAFARQC